MKLYSWCDFSERSRQTRFICYPEKLYGQDAIIMAANKGKDSCDFPVIIEFESETDDYPIKVEGSKIRVGAGSLHLLARLEDVKHRVLKIEDIV